MKQLYKFVIGTLLGTLAMEQATAESVFDKETVTVIQDRIYDRTHEVTFNAGYIPDDDFYEANPLGVAYTYHFNKTIAWEVGRLQYVHTTEKQIRNDLQNNFNVQAEEFDRMVYMAHSTFVLKPTYGKDAIWDSGIINHESYLSLGAGVVNYEREYSDPAVQPTEETVLSITAGMGRKYFLSKSVAMNLEVKSYTNFKDSKTETNVYLGLGVSYRFNFSNRINAVRRTTDSVYRYLEDEEE